MLKSVGSNWALNVVQLLVGFILPRLLIHALGTSTYGVWGIVVSATDYLTLLLLGVPMATAREFTQHVARKDQARLNSSIASAMGLYLGLGLVASLAGFVLYGLFDRVYATDIAGRLGPDVASQARAAFIITMLQVTFGFVSQVPPSVMVAHRDFFVRNLITIGGILFRLALVVIWLRSRSSLAVLAWIHAIQMVVEFAVSSVVVTRRYPGTRLSLAGFDKAEVRSIVGFSMFVLLLTLGNKLSFRTSALVLGAFENEAAVTAFSIPLGLVLNLTDFVLAIGAVVMPTAIKYRVEGRDKELAAMFLQWSKVALSLALVAGLYLVVLGGDFVRVWIDKSDFDSHGAGEVLTILMLSHFVFLPIRGIGLPILMGLGKPARPTVAFLIAGILNLGIGLTLVRPFGLVGVALGIAIPDVLFAVYVLGLVCRELNVSWKDYVGYVAGKAAIGSIPVLGVLFLFQRTLVLQSFPPLILSGIASTALFAVIWVFFVYRNDPYIDAAGRLRRLFAFARKRTP